MKRFRDIENSEESENKRCKVDIAENFSELCDLIKQLQIIDTNMADKVDQNNKG